MFSRIFVSMWLLFLVVPVATASPDPLDEFVKEGRIQAGLAAFKSPANNSERFSLAVLQALEGLEHFSAGFNTLGIDPSFAMGGLPFLRVVVPNAQLDSVQPATPEKVAGLFRSLRTSLRNANSTLAGIDEEEFGVMLNLSKAHLDFNGDGTVDLDETLLASLGQVLGQNARTEPGMDLIVRFDSADAMWLQGYTHFLSGFLDLLLAYDWGPVWDQCAHVVFLDPEPRPEIVRWSDSSENFGDWADLIAAVHDMRLELTDKKAWPRARDEFRSMISCSRKCWERVDAETDNDLEWLPSARQTGPDGATISQAQIDGWQPVLDELDAIATGKKLLPHWRMRPGVGISIKKMVASPPQLDLVLLIHGSALFPYLEEGPVSDGSTWNNLTAPFGRGFFRFALWSN